MNTKTKTSAQSRMTDIRNRDIKLFEAIKKIKESSKKDLSLRDVARILNNSEHNPPRGQKFFASTVSRIIRSGETEMKKATGDVNPHDPKEPRTQKVNGKTKAYKTIGLQFNRYERWELEQGIKKSKRSVNSIIRDGIKKELEVINNHKEILSPSSAIEMKIPLTKKQKKIFDFLKKFIDTKSYPPTRSEIAKFFGFKSANSSEDHLKAIQSKGWIKLTRGTYRGITILDDPNSNTE